MEKFLNESENLFVYKKGEVFFKNKVSKDERLFEVKGKDGLNAVGVKNNLYIPDGDFVDEKNIFENFFSDEFEAPYNEFVEYVEENFFDVKKILDKYHAYIINLISSMMARTLHHKIEIEDICKTFFQQHEKINSKTEKYTDDLRQILKNEFPELDDDKLNESIADYINMINDGAFNVKISRNLFIKKMMSTMKHHSYIISDMTIQILRTNEKSFFITSDNPAVYFVPKGKENFYFKSKSLAGPFTELYFPLSKNLCLLLSRYPIEVLSGIPLTLDNRNIIKEINKTIAFNSRDFIYSPYLASFLDKFIVEKTPYPFKFSFGDK